MHKLIGILLPGLLVLLSACTGQNDAAGTTVEDVRPAVTGTASYREKIRSPPDALVEINLLDVSLMDVAAKLISRQTISADQGPPFTFRLHYDPEVIDQRLTYAVQARILGVDGRLLFITDTSYQVLTRGKPDHVDLVLKHIQN